ncbi:MAG: MarR family transcriptional regulator [Ponticaulis sp.]|nr:MarR family transcriptional regulator [Ponticaulis sp.]
MTTNPVGMFPGYLLRQATNATLNRLYERLKPLDLRLAEASVLVLIQSNPGVTQSQAGQPLKIARANMAPLVRRLEDAGLVSREAVDGRSYGLYVTEKGDDMARRANAAMQAHESELMAFLPPHLRGPFAEALTCLGEFYTEAEESSVG